MARSFHYRLCHAFGFDSKILSLLDHEHVQCIMKIDNLMWNRPIYGLRKIHANKDDLVFVYKPNEILNMNMLLNFQCDWNDSEESYQVCSLGFRNV